MVTVTCSLAMSCSACAASKLAMTLRCPYIRPLASQQKPTRPYIGNTVSATSCRDMSKAWNMLNNVALL
ncbi:hypothetical protein D3C71_2178420 [compost metagenome]